MKMPKTFTVGEHSFTVQQYMTSYGMQLLTRITTLLGPQLVELATKMSSGDEGKVLEGDLEDIEGLGQIFEQLALKVKPDTLNTLFKDILVGTIIDSKGSTTCAEAYDTFFQGRYQLLFSVVWKTLGAQYGDFLGALGGLAKFAKMKANQA